jgi:hypothetical protein
MNIKLKSLRAKYKSGAHLPHDSSEKGRIDRFGSEVIQRAQKEIGVIATSKISGMLIRGDWKGMVAYLESRSEDDSAYRMLYNFVTQQIEKRNLPISWKSMETKHKAFSDGSHNDAVDYARSVASKFKGKGRYMIDGIHSEIRKYERPNDENYYDFARRFMSDDEIEREWIEATKRR